jgi:hypothetical protein
MPVLEPREQLAFKANLWRWETILRRNKKQVCKIFTAPIIYTLILIAIDALLKSHPTNIEATSSIYASGSDPKNPYWSDSAANISSLFNFTDCAASPSVFNSIGYVMSASASQAEQNVVSSITNQFIEIWQTNNSTEVPPMTAVNFTTYKDLNTYVLQKNYFENQLCFAFEFTAFNITAR